MSTEGRAGVLFDVDGTLVDSNYLHVLSWSRALRDAGKWAPMNAIHRLVGMGGDQLITELLGHECPAAREARPAHYEELKGDMVAFPHAGDLLRHVHQMGLAVVLATSTPQNELHLSRRLLDADDAIDAATSADDVDAAKPSPKSFSPPWTLPALIADTPSRLETVFGISGRLGRLASVASASSPEASVGTS